MRIGIQGWGSEGDIPGGQRGPAEGALVLEAEPLRRRASELATSMTHEDGTGTATRLLEKLADS